MAPEKQQGESATLSTMLGAAHHDLPQLQYAKLNTKDGRCPIRLVALLPARTSDIVRCNLIYCDLEAGLEYEALSYCWSDPKDQMSIICDDTRLQITNNLEVALRHLRDEKETRVLWIDGICINQSDLDEREQQVAIMKDIYSRASRTVVWLGEESPEDIKAFEICWRLISSVGTRMQPNRKDLWANPMSLPRNTMDGFRGMSQKDLTPLLHLLERPWFKRMWVIQETAVAKQVLVMCGNEQIDLDRLYIGVALMAATTPSGLRRVARTVHALLLQYELKEKRNQELTQLAKLLLYTRRFEASDPRDKVYALLGLTSTDIAALGLRADYHFSVAEVYKRVAAALLQHEHRLELLESSRGETALRKLLPSWVPDWSDSSPSEVPLIESAHEDYLAGLGTRVNRLLRVLQTKKTASRPHPDPEFAKKISEGLTEEHRAMLGEIAVTQTVDVDLDVEETMRIFKDQDPPEGRKSPEFAASKCSIGPMPKVGDDDSLILTGHAADKITQLGRTLPSPRRSTNTSTVELHQAAGRRGRLGALQQLAQNVVSEARESGVIELEWSAIALTDKPYPTGETQLRAYWQTLCAGHFEPADLDQTEADFLRHQKVLRNMLAVERSGVLTGPTSVIQGLQPSMIPGYDKSTHRKEKGPRLMSKFVAEKSVRRRLARTEGGFLALVPPEAEFGDTVVLLAGGRLPFVLRSRNDRAWELIGPTYVHGIMYGEAFEESSCEEIMIR